MIKRTRFLRLRAAGIVAVYCVVVTNTFAADTPPENSLFFTPAETQKINALASKDFQNPAARQDVHLGAIMYYGPDDWTLWLQGELWTPATQKDDLKILSVQPDEVRLFIPNAASTPPHTITLRPNQTWQAASGMIIEGDPK